MRVIVRRKGHWGLQGERLGPVRGLVRRARSEVLGSKGVKCVTLGVRRRALALLELLRLSLVFAEDVLVEAVGEGFRKGRDVEGTQGGGSIYVIRRLALSVHCHQ